MSNGTHDLVIIGAGPAGLTAGLYGHRSGLKTLVIGGETPGGQVTFHYRIENYPGFPGGVAGAELMAMWIKQLLDETGAMPLPESVTHVNFSGPVKELFTPLDSYRARSVIVCTGAKPRRLNIPGERELEGKGVFFCATCDAPLLRTMDRRRTVVLGGGDTAFHTALSLIPHAESVTVVARGSEVRASPVLVEKFLDEESTTVLHGFTPKAIFGESSVNGVAVEHTGSGETRTLETEAVFVGIGQSPAKDFLEGAVDMTPQGFIMTDRSLETSAKGVFAAGDVRDTPLRQIVSAAADGALAAQSAARYLRAAST